VVWSLLPRCRGALLSWILHWWRVSLFFFFPGRGLWYLFSFLALWIVLIQQRLLRALLDSFIVAPTTPATARQAVLWMS